MNQVEAIKGLKQIYHNYDTFILDQWGVMHDGFNGFVNAIICVEKLFLEKKNLIIISNSSKRKRFTLQKLPDLGFNKNYFIEVMTSGEMIWQSMLRRNFKETKKLKEKCFLISSELENNSNNFLNGLDEYKLVSDINEADFILGCTPFTNSKVLDYIPLLDLALTKELPFICANPDYETVKISEFEDNVDTEFCMGTIAELYQNMGGGIFFLGKPSIEIYKESTKNIKNLDKTRILAIGDSLQHDINGSIKFGVDSLLITSNGIHKKYFDIDNPRWDLSNKNLVTMGINPTFICSELVF